MCTFYDDTLVFLFGAPEFHILCLLMLLAAELMEITDYFKDHTLSSLTASKGILQGDYISSYLYGIQCCLVDIKCNALKSPFFNHEKDPFSLAFSIIAT